MSDYPFYNAHQHIQHLEAQARHDRLVREARQPAKKEAWWSRWFNPVKPRPELSPDEAIRLSAERRAELLSQEGLSGLNR